MTLRALLVVLVLALVAGTPGLGLETRTDASVLTGALYAVPFLAAIAALIATWRWPRPALWLAALAGLATVVLSALDLLGLTDPTRPPLAVAIVEIAAVIVSLAILWLASRRTTARA
jgi:hypothetical protein